MRFPWTPTRISWPARVTTLLMVAITSMGAGCQIAEPADTDTAAEESVDDATTTGSEPAATPQDDAGSQTEQTDTPEQTDPPDDVPASPAPQDSGGPSTQAACSPETAEQIDRVIGAQLDEFVAGNFAGALDWATPGFRQSFTPEDFEAMITQQFAVPATATDHTVTECGEQEGFVLAGVTITGREGQQPFEYALQLLDEGWRIEGAVPLGPPQASEII